MLRPVLMVGCGGSGTKAVRYVRDAVERRLLYHGWDEEFPSAWQFVGVDTLTTQEEPDEIPTLPPEDFISLSSRYNTYGPLHSALLAKHRPDDHQSAYSSLIGWVPSPQKVTIPLADGAGQNRAVGRAAGLATLSDYLTPRLTKAFAQVKNGYGALRQASELLGSKADDGSAMPEPVVVVITSAAGGTGAGISLDVIDLLRSLDRHGSFPALVLFTPDIFDTAGSEAAMAANSLGFISEAMSAYYADADSANPLMPSVRKDPGKGPHSMFLIGRHGMDGADLGDTASVYRSAGESLSHWVTSQTVQSRVHNFITVNWLNNSKKNHGGVPFGERHQRGAVSSFGAASVTVGRDRFQSWAEDLLAAETLDALDHGHLSKRPSRPPSDDSESALVEALAADMTSLIASNSLMSLLFDAHEHLVPDEAAEAQRIEKHLKAPFGSSHSGSGTQWSTWIRSQLASSVPKKDPPDPALWGSEALSQACQAASRVVSETSLKVAAETFRQTKKSLSDRAQRFRSESSKISAESSSMMTDALKAMAKSGTTKGSSGRVAACCQAVSRAHARAQTAEALETTAASLDSATAQLIQPIISSLESAAVQVAQELSADRSKRLPRSGSGIPPSYLPTAVEFQLEPPSDWPKLLDSIAQEAVYRPHAGHRSEDAIRAVITEGDSEGMRSLMTPMLPARWTPGSQASVSCQADLDSIKRRIRSWFRRPGSKTSILLSEGLRSYLSERDPFTKEATPQRAARLDRYRASLAQARAYSQPLVLVNESLYRASHPQTEPSTILLCSSFPFSSEHPAAEVTKDTVGPDSYSHSEADSSAVLLSSFVADPMHLLVARSVTEPIAAAVKACGASADELQASFWMWRRARTLDEFVPFPEQITKALAKGFMTARLLGCVGVSVSPSEPVRISALDGSIYDFPWPLLSRVEPDDTLPALLESLPLSLALAGPDGMGAFSAYKEMYSLGDTKDDDVHSELSAYLSGGDCLRPSVGGSPKAQGPNRRESALKYLKANIDRLTSLSAPAVAYDGTEHRSDDGSADRDVPTMELAPMLLRCAQLMHDAIASSDYRESVV